jgi:anaerobic magnesium-protoporphyrin IX monomethyl ester cyclase
LIDVLLIYPFQRKRFDRSPFRFPPLGIGYIASSLKQRGFKVEVLDCTFRDENDLLDQIEGSKPKIIGIYSMYLMERESISIARKIKHTADLLVAGGPLPTINSKIFLDDFDIVVVGEAEVTMLEIVEDFLDHKEPKKVNGIVFKDNFGIKHTPKREHIVDLDLIPFPARELFDNDAYKEYYQKSFGYTMTSMISSRGCPFKCDFCSRPVFGESFRSRSATNIVDEMELISKLGYDSIWFADDCFTMSKDRVIKICDEIIRRDLQINWQCLSRVDTRDHEMFLAMKKAGCRKIFFGVESGDKRILKLMKKNVEIPAAREAICNASSVGIDTGAFFIIGYPGESNDTILNTIRFGTSLPLDYLSFTLPYPIPGTGLYDKVKDVLRAPSKKKIRLVDHELHFKSEFSEFKLKFAIVKATVQFRIRKYFGDRGYSIVGRLFEKISDMIFRSLE